MGFTAKAKYAAVLLDPKPLAAFLALSDGITVVPLALPLTCNANRPELAPL